MALPTQTISYNGYTFPTETETVGVSIRPVYDSSGRTVVQSVYSLTLRARVAAGATQGETLATIRSALERPGGAFVYEGRGFGDFELNVGGRQDLAWGPKPTLITWKPIGGSQSADMTWQVEMALLGCDSAPTTGQVMETNYKISFDTDYAGYTKRTITGYFRIPQTRASANVAGTLDTADDYFERFFAAIPTGYQRKTNRRDLSEDKCRLDFNFVDEPLPVALPDGIVACSASHALGTENFYSSKWVGTIRGSYEVSPKESRTLAYDRFLELVTLRAKEEKATLGSGTAYVLKGMSIVEPALYGREAAQFSISYLVTTGSQLKPIGGLWRPVPGDHNKWATSIASITGPRGMNGMRHRSSDDVIVDLCLLGGQPIPSGDSQFEIPKSVPAGYGQKLADALGDTGQPAPEDSWVEYRNQVYIERLDHLIFHKPLPSTPISTDPLVPSQEAPSDKAAYRFEELRSPPLVPQITASPTYFVRMKGRALRVGYTIPQPILEKVGGHPVLPMNDPEKGCFWTEFLAGWGGRALYGARWSFRYLVVQSESADQPYEVVGSESKGLLKHPMKPEDLGRV